MVEFEEEPSFRQGGSTSCVVAGSDRFFPEVEGLFDCGIVI